MAERRDWFFEDKAGESPKKAGGAAQDPVATPPLPQDEPAADTGAAHAAGRKRSKGPAKAKKGGEGKPVDPEEKPGMLSPSQINLFLSCPRKWYFRYVLKLPEEESFAQARGSAAHYVAEHFFEYRPAGAMSLAELETALRRRGRMLLAEAWKKFGIADKWPEESQEVAEAVVDRFVTRILWQVEEKMRKTGDVVKAWSYIAPAKRELEVVNEELGLRGFIDAVIEKDGHVYLLDYKTSSVFLHPHSDDYERQLLLYALLYERSEGVLPKVVSIEYLLTGETWSFPVRRPMVDEVEGLVREVRGRMHSRKITDYPMDDKRKFCRWCSYAKDCSEASN